MMYEYFEHTADLGLRVHAADLNALFADAARGLTGMIVADPETIRPQDTRQVHLDGQDRDYLLFDWLNELLYLFESERFLGSRFDVQVRDTGLDAVIRGEVFDPQRHEPDHEVKAITYHGLSLEPADDGWQAEVIVDI